MGSVTQRPLIPLSPARWAKLAQALAFPLPHPAIDSPILKVYWAPATYPDASHQLVFIKTATTAYYLKWPKKQVKSQNFWRLSQAWFQLDIHSNYQFPVASEGIWAQLSAASSLRWVQPLEVKHYVLTRAVENYGIPPILSNQALDKLRAHFKAMQSFSSAKMGCLVNPRLNLSDWWQRLECGFQLTTISKQRIESALAAARDYPEQKAVPLMLDWRWDQLAWQAGLPDTIIDLDAWVWAPETLNWVMLEYLLAGQSDEEISRWLVDLQVNQRQLEAWREVYRLLLFAMNWQGETNLDTWLAAPKLFKA